MSHQQDCIIVEVENQFQHYNLCQLGRDPQKSSRNLLPGLQTATNKEELRWPFA